MHSSYQLNTVFTDVYLFTPTELQVSSSCNMTNQPLFLRYNPAVEPVLHGARGSGVSPPPGGTRAASRAAARRQTWPARLHGREEADGQQVCLRLGSIEETEANHTVYNTPDSPVQQFCCICVSFVRIPKDEKLSCLSHQKLTAECEVGGL